MSCFVYSRNIGSLSVVQYLARKGIKWSDEEFVRISELTRCWGSRHKSSNIPHNSGGTEWSRYHANSHQLCFTGEKRREEKSEVCLTQKSESLQQRNPRRRRRRNAFMILIQFPPRHSNIAGNGNQSENLFWKHFPFVSKWNNIWDLRAEGWG